MAFDLIKLLTDVFDPEPGEAVIVACDKPRVPGDDTPVWAERREWAGEWQRAFQALGKGRGFETKALLVYGATGANNAELPARGFMEGKEVVLDEVLLGSTLACFLTQYSATAPLDGVTRRKRDFRAASMPGLERRMERTALSADYREVARRCGILDGLLRGADALDVTFSTGHACHFDLRYRQPEVDDGFLPRSKQGDRIINLPSGEAFIVPYEGERPGDPSATRGAIPHRVGNELVVFRIADNHVVKVEGEGDEAKRLRAFFAYDAARANIAEVAFGCNEWAEVTGNVLEDEKAGFHWAYGRSEHLGGTVGPKSFVSPDTVVHQDIVYAKGNPIQVVDATLVRADSRVRVIRNGAYIVF